MKQAAVDKQLFIGNRARFSSRMLPNSLAVFFANDEMPRSGDQHFPFRQNADLFYLSGIDQEQTILMLYPDCPLEKYREVLFLRETNETIAVWEGNKYTKEEARLSSGINTILWLDQYEGVLRELMINAGQVYLNSNEYIKYSVEVETREIRLGKALMGRYPFHAYHRSAPLMRQLRLIKQDLEIALIKTAVSISRKAFLAALALVKPGVMEYEIEAEISRELIRNRASGHAFLPIIASGASACILHYIENNRMCKDGDLLLMDFGAEYANYSSDITRTIPVNGRFSSRQKAVYQAVLRVMQQAKTMLVLGNTIDNYHAAVGRLMEEELIGLGLLQQAQVKAQDPDKPLYLRYYPHGTTHFMGLDVHDLGFKQQKFEAGMVFTCEPGIYIREEGIGVRLENDILLSTQGPIDLMEDIPLEINEIEELMQ